MTATHLASSPSNSHVDTHYTRCSTAAPCCLSSSSSKTPGASTILVMRAMTALPNRSPDTLMAVRKRSRSQSIATMTANIPVTSTPTELAIMTMRTSEADGIGVVPMEASVASKQMIT